MNILAIGAHPDDIEIGCGGTLVKYAKKNHDIYLLVLTEGEGASGGGKTRKREQENSAKCLKAKELFWGGFMDTKVPVNKESISIIESIIKKTKPELVFFNYPKDIHQDHRSVSDVCISASRYVKNVLMYEVPTTQGLEPDVFVDIGEVIKDKLKLLKIHISQVDKMRVPHLTILDSAKACANFRGFQGRVKYAEGFKSLRLTLDF